MFICVGLKSDVSAITFHVHSVVLFKYFHVAAFRDHLAIAEKLEGNNANTVEFVGDPPSAWRTLLKLIYAHFDLLYDESRYHTPLHEVARNLLEESAVGTELFEVALLCHKHGWELSWMDDERARRLKEDMTT